MYQNLDRCIFIREAADQFCNVNIVQKTIDEIGRALCACVRDLHVPSNLAEGNAHQRQVPGDLWLAA